MSKQSLAIQGMVGIGIGLAALFAFGKFNQIPSLSRFAAIVNEEPAEPTIAIDRAEWDFGNVSPGSVREATFEICNVGGSRLILRKTNGDCDCVSTGEAEIIIEPGGRRTVSAILNAHQLSGPVKIGVHYQTNDPQRRRLSLFCLADISRQ